VTLPEIRADATPDFIAYHTSGNKILPIRTNILRDCQRSGEDNRRLTPDPQSVSHLNSEKEK
jgi:hypothetical protein